MDRKQLTFEDYLSLFRDQDTKNFNIHKLKHALSINGFGGLKTLSRKEIIDAMNSVNLAPPTRSTMDSGNVPIRSRHMSTLSLEELKSDINEMGWQECPIGSIVTIDPATTGVAKSKRVKKPTVNNNNNKKKRVRKVKKTEEKENELALALPSAESLAVDAVANGDATEQTSPVKNLSKLNRTSPVKKMSKTVRVPATMLNDADEFSWTNMGFQKLKRSPHPRNYFKCKKWKKGCPAKRRVDPDPIDPSIIIISYNGEHNHSVP